VGEKNVTMILDFNFFFPFQSLEHDQRPWFFFFEKRPWFWYQEELSRKNIQNIFLLITQAV
jgi:hypothetical protein